MNPGTDGDIDLYISQATGDDHETPNHSWLTAKENDVGMDPPPTVTYRQSSTFISNLKSPNNYQSSTATSSSSYLLSPEQRTHIEQEMRLQTSHPLYQQLQQQEEESCMLHEIEHGTDT